MQQIADWLQKLDFGQYTQHFAENEIDSKLPGGASRDEQLLERARVRSRPLLPKPRGEACRDYFVSTIVRRCPDRPSSN
jgi:SAM domain (Sterile alpha motif)